MKSKEDEIKLKDKDIKSLQADLLRVQGLLSGRGIFEHVLKGVFDEEELKGNFNAASTCNHLAKVSKGTHLFTYIFHVNLL